MQNAWIMASCESGQNGVKKLFTKRRPLFSFSELIRHKTDDSDCYNYKFIKIQFKDKTIKPLFKKRQQFPFILKFNYRILLQLTAYSSFHNNNWVNLWKIEII